MKQVTIGNRNVPAIIQGWHRQSGYKISAKPHRKTTGIRCQLLGSRGYLRRRHL